MNKNLIRGVVTTNRKGFGFISDPHDEEHDFYINEGDLNCALNGDEVEAEIIVSKGEDKSAKVKKILVRNKENYVGTVEERGGILGVVPDDKKMYANIMLTSEESAKVAVNDRVFIKINDWKNPNEKLFGKIIKVIGKKGNNNAEMESIVLESGFEIGFPKEVEEESEDIAKNEGKIQEEEIQKRRDIRDTLTFTIDPFDAKDFDDAISFKELGNKGGENLYEIGVHIADVSHYVREGSNLDKEAVKRGCSIYLVDRTIPMLPEILSNDLCSLNPNEDKLTFSAIFIMNEKAEVKESWFGRTVIHSDYRFTYETAQESIDSKKGHYANELIKLNQIAKILQKEKFHKGAIEFEQEEIKFRLDENGKPIGVYKKERLDTHKLVEEYMLLANREVAKFIHDCIKKKGTKDTGSIYRIHDIPDPERMMELESFVKALGYDLNTKKGKVSSHNIKSLLKQVEGTSHEALIKTAAIRSMQKAVYSTKNIGHFGLAFEYYTHFTSPIRRYPDLLVHRILAKHLHHEPFKDKEIIEFQNIAESSTAREIDAADAERASKKLKQVEYMSERIGESFFGTISGVTEWGIYIEEKETKCEGMVKIRDLGNDFFEFNRKTYSIVGQKTKRTFTLGDEVKFKVLSADLDKKTLDFSLV